LYASEPYYREALDRARSGRKAAPTPTSPAPRQQIAQLWRKRNRHNETYLARKFDIDRVKVGRASYGPLDVRTFGPPDEQLTIGHFVSIADGVTFVLGGNHPYRGFSSFPFKVKLLGHPHESQTKGPISVGDDVWIGTNAMILSGVTIGQGAIIGAGAVVTTDVPPYAIVAGNPMRVLKYRFSPAVIAKLLTLNFGLLHPDTLIAHADKLYEELTEANIDQILEQIQRVPATPMAAVA
jgi:acetyltransferase-like isoleucine patch superfamily enzyme